MNRKIFVKVFPFWPELTGEQQEEIIKSATANTCEKKTRLHFGGGECAGVQIVAAGRARVFIPSPGGGDSPLFRRTEGDVRSLIHI